MKRSMLCAMLFFILWGSGSQETTAIEELTDSLNETLSGTARVDLLNRIAEEHQYIDPEEQYHYAEDALEMSQQINYQKGIAEAWNNIGTYFRVRGIYNESIDYYFRSLEIMEKIKDEKGIARCYNLIGILYYNLENYNLSLTYFRKALEMNYAQNDKKWIAGNSNNMGMIYEQLNDHEKALAFYMKSLEMNLELGNKNWIANNFGNIGSLYQLMGKPGSLEYFMKRLAITEEQNDTIGIALSFLFIGNYFMAEENHKDALPYLQQAHDLGLVMGSLSTLGQASEKLSTVYSKLADSKSALAFEKLNKRYEDSLKLYDNTERITILQMQYSQKQKEQIREVVHNKIRTIQTLVAVVLFFVLVIIFLLFNRQRIKANQQKLEQNNLLLGNKLLQDELHFKENMLKENVKYLLDINDLLTKTLDRLNALMASTKTENKQVIKEIILNLQTGANDEIWKEFETRFNQIHKDFYLNLNNNFPDLSANEKKLCAFLKLKMTSREISAITSSSIKSIETARSRLRKKLNIQDKSINIAEFLDHF